MKGLHKMIRRTLLEWCEENGERGQQLQREFVGVDEYGNEISLEDVTAGSPLKVSWRCDKCAEMWLATPGHRTSRGSGCPYCSGHRVSAKNSLVNWCKDNGEFGKRLMEEWTGLDENGKYINIEEVSYGSKTRMQWECRDCRCIWPVRIVDRTKYKTNCPTCYKNNSSKINAEAKLKSGINDFYTWCKNHGEYGKRVLSECQGVDKNGNEVDLHKITYGNHRIQILFKCSKCASLFYSTPNKRTVGYSCAYCAGMAVNDTNSLAVWCNNNGERGELIRHEWRGINENGKTININEVTAHSKKIASWECEKGHRWTGSVFSRINLGYNCPYCSGRRLTYDNSLDAWCDRNGEYGNKIRKQYTGLDENGNYIDIKEISKHNGKRLYWECEKCGERWPATVANRTFNRSGCPKCSCIGTSFPEQFLYRALKQIYPSTENRCRVLKSEENPRGIEFDIGIPDIPLCIEYCGAYWHMERFDKDIEKMELCEKKGIRLINIYEDGSNEMVHKFSENYICFHENSIEERNKKLVEILEYILSTLNHSISEINIEKAKEDAFNFMHNIEIKEAEETKETVEAVKKPIKKKRKKKNQKPLIFDRFKL